MSTEAHSEEYYVPEQESLADLSASIAYSLCCCTELATSLSIASKDRKKAGPGWLDP